MSWRVSGQQENFGRVSIAFAVSVAAALASAKAAPALADEAYLCGPDRVVYVAAADLEAKKKTDPCIASYYGLKISEPAIAPLAEVKKDVERVLAPPALVVDVAEQLKVLPRDEPLAPASPRAERQAYLEPPKTAAGTDYRNVRIINASAPHAVWYSHTK